MQFPSSSAVGCKDSQGPIALLFSNACGLLPFNNRCSAFLLWGKGEVSVYMGGESKLGASLERGGITETLQTCPWSWKDPGIASQPSDSQAQLFHLLALCPISGTSAFS